MGRGYRSVKEKIIALYYKNKLNDVYTITMVGDGGPIISSNSLEEGKKAFEEALNLSCAVKNLLYFNKRESASRSPSTRVNKSPTISYEELTL